MAAPTAAHRPLIYWRYSPFSVHTVSAAAIASHGATSLIHCLMFLSLKNAAQPEDLELHCV